MTSQSRSNICSNDIYGHLMDVSRSGFRPVDPEPGSCTKPGQMKGPWGEGRANHLSTLAGVYQGSHCLKESANMALRLQMS